MAQQNQIPATVRLEKLSTASPLTGSEAFLVFQTTATSSFLNAVQSRPNVFMIQTAVTTLGPFATTFVTNNAIMYGQGSSLVQTVNFSTVGFVLAGVNATNAPVYTTLPIGGGGLGTSSFPAHTVLLGAPGGGIGETTTQTAGQLLIGQSVVADPSWMNVGKHLSLTAGGTATINPGAAGFSTLSTSVAVVVGLGVPSSSNYLTGTIYTTSPPYGLDTPINMGTVANNDPGRAFTRIRLLNAQGGTPTATNPILIPFSTSTGSVIWSSVGTSTVLTLSSGANFAGGLFGAANRFWVSVFYASATTVIPAIIVCTNTGTIFPVPEIGIAGSQTLTSNSTTAGVFYGNVAASATSYRLVGFMDINILGTWGSQTISNVQTLQPGIPRPGQVVQVSAPFYGTLASTAFTTVLVTTNVTAAITLSSLANPVRFSAVYSVQNLGTGAVTSQVFRIGGGNIAIGNVSRIIGTGGMGVNIGIDFFQSTTTAVYVVKAAASAGSTSTIPSANADSASFILEELMG